jgi:hypothetical protein
MEIAARDASSLRVKAFIHADSTAPRASSKIQTTRQLV